jgi:hypothetical protein
MVALNQPSPGDEGPEPQYPGITTMAFVTRDRPSALARALTSYADNVSRHGRTVRFAVFDAADADGQDGRCPGVLQRFAASAGAHPVLYAGIGEKRRHIDRLCRETAVPRDVTTFALLPDIPGTTPYGANRNAQLLHCAGELLLSADDDTVCRAASPADQPHGVATAIGRDPAQYWFFASREDTCTHVREEDVDVLGAHEALLGRTLWSIAQRSNDGLVPAVQAQGTATDIARLTSTGTSVAATFGGIYGDCGWGSPFGWWGGPMGYLMLDEVSHQRLTRSRDGYLSALASREILRTVCRPTLSDASFSMTTVVGLDHRSLLPPFVPVQRGEDVIFGRILWRCFARRCVGHVPVAVLHDPTPRRFSPREIIRSASGFDTAKLILAALDLCGEPSSREPAEALMELGRRLEDLAARPAAEFLRLVRAAITDINEAFAEDIQRHVADHADGAAFWAKDLTAFRSLLRDASRAEDYIVPLDLLAKRSADEACALGQNLVRRFGALLVWWPIMVAAGRDFASHGETLASPIVTERGAIA